MITVKFPFLTQEIKSSTYAELLKIFMQTTNKSLTKIQNTIPEILKNKINKNIYNVEEDEAKYIWNIILSYYPKAEIKGILYDPLKQWYKVEIYNKDTKELYNAKFIKETCKNQAINNAITDEEEEFMSYGDYGCYVTDRLTLEETKNVNMKMISQHLKQMDVQDKKQKNSWKMAPLSFLQKSGTDGQKQMNGTIKMN